MIDIYFTTKWEDNEQNQLIYSFPPQNDTIKYVSIFHEQCIITQSEILLLWSPIKSELIDKVDYCDPFFNSYMIKVKVLEKQKTESSWIKKYRVKILKSTKITEPPIEDKSKFSLPVCLDTTTNPYNKYILWERTNWSAYFQIGNYILIEAIQCETRLETILINHKINFEIIYHTEDNPGGTLCFWGSYKTSKKETEIFQNLIKKSEKNEVDLTDITF